MKIGYARVSTKEQNLDAQINELKNYGCEVFFSEIISGTKAKRKELIKLLDYARYDDVIVVSRLDRLGRSLKELIELITLLNNKNIRFVSLKENIDTTTTAGQLIFHIFGALAEFERNLIRDRTNAGLQAARARGRFGGRRPALTDEQIKSIKVLHADKTIPIDKIAKQFNISRTTLYNYLKTK